MKKLFIAVAFIVVSMTASAQIVVTSPVFTPLTGGSVDPTQSICSGQAPTLFNSTSPAGGGSGTYVYLWQSSVNLITWSNTTGTGATYQAGTLTTTTYYRRRVIDPGCGDTAYSNVLAVVVNPIPVVVATATPATICAGQASNISATGATSYNWNPGNLSGTPVSVTPTSTTTYTVTGILAGCTGTGTVTVTVNPIPIIAATATPATICAGQASNISATGATSYNWNPGNLSGTPVSVTPTSTTTYTVTGTLAGCTGTGTVTVTVNPIPIVAASANPTTVCAGQPSTLTAAGNATIYNWNPGNLSGSPVTVNPATTTTYTLTGDLNGCGSTSTVTVTVNPIPNVTASASPAAVCLGNSTTLTANGASSYSWTPGNLTGGSVVITPTTTTTYTVTGTQTGCTGTGTVTVTVNPKPTGSATVSSANCANMQLNVTGLTGGNSWTVWTTSINNFTAPVVSNIQNVTLPSNSTTLTVQSPMSGAQYYIWITNNFGCDNQ